MPKVTRHISLGLFAILFAETLIRAINGWINDTIAFSEIDWFSMPLHLIQIFAKSFSLVALVSGVYYLVFRNDYRLAAQFFIICAVGMAVMQLSPVWGAIALAGIIFMVYGKAYLNEGYQRGSALSVWVAYS